MTYALKPLLSALFVLAIYWPLGLRAQDLRSMAPPPPDKARIIFIRVKQAMGSLVGADILEVINDKPQLVSQLWQEEKLVLETTPGPKTFMTVGYGPTPTLGYTIAGDLLFAELAAGKTYYVVLRYHPGSTGIIPNPVRAGGPFQQDSKLVVKGMTSYRLIRQGQDEKAVPRQDYGERVQKEYQRVSKLFERKTPSQIVERTLRLEDSVM